MCVFLATKEIDPETHLVPWASPPFICNIHIYIYIYIYIYIRRANGPVAC